MLPKGNDVMLTQHHPTVYAALGPSKDAMPDVIILCVLSKGNNNIPCLPSSDRVYFPREIIVCNAQGV